MHQFQVVPTPLCVICEAGSRCTMTDATCCLSNITGEKCPLPRTHLIGMLLQLSIIPFALKDTTRTHAWAHTSTRHAAQPSIQVFMPSRFYGGRNTPVAQNAAHSQLHRHTHARQRASTFRGIHANPRAPCGHTRTRMHAVAPAARALSSYARSMAWQL